MFYFLVYVDVYRTLEQQQAYLDCTNIIVILKLLVTTCQNSVLQKSHWSRTKLYTLHNLSQPYICFQGIQSKMTRVSNVCQNT